MSCASLDEDVKFLKQKVDAGTSTCFLRWSTHLGYSFAEYHGDRFGVCMWNDYNCSTEVTVQVLKISDSIHTNFAVRLWCHIIETFGWILLRRC